MPRFSPNTGPPRSRMLVKPRISMSWAAFTAATLMKPDVAGQHHAPAARWRT
jgi:hypothetical protein